MNNGNMNIAFCFDEKYSLGYLVTMISLFENNKSENIKVYLITPGLSSDVKAKFDELANIYHQTLIYKVMDDSLFDGLPLYEPFGKATYFRYTIPELCPESKVLQLDGDVLIRKNLRKMYDTDVSDVAMAVVEGQSSDDIYNINRLRLESPTFNNGVQLMNLDYWRDNNVAKLCRDYLISNKDICIYVDQDANNVILHDKVKYLPYTYNMQQVFFWEDSRLRLHYSKWEELKKYRDNPAIVHFCSRMKPWIKGCNEPFRDEWIMYAKMYNFIDFKEQRQHSFLFQIVSYIANNYIRRFLKCIR